MTAAPPRRFVQAFGPVYNAMVRAVGPVGSTFPQAVVSSWYRDTAANLRAGGDFDSQHLAGFAFDVDTPDRRDYPGIAALGARAGFVTVIERDHVHFQTFPRNARVIGALRAVGFLPELRFL